MKISSCITNISSNKDQLFHKLHLESISRDVEVILFSLLCFHQLFAPVSLSLVATGEKSEHVEFVEPAFDIPLSPEMNGIMPCESESQYYIERYGYPDEATDSPRQVPKSAAKSKAAPRVPAIRYRYDKLPLRKFPEGKQVILSDSDGAYVEIGEVSKLVSFADSNILHYRHCGAVTRNVRSHLQMHDYESCACLEKFYVNKDYLRDADGKLHGFSMYAHVVGKYGHKYFRACKVCMQIPKLG